MFKLMFDHCISYLKTVNIYRKKEDDTVEKQQTQLIATRLFIILFLISLTGLVGYASLTVRLSDVQIKNPSQSTFEQLYMDYSETLICPCSQTSIEMRKFTDFNIFYHQICSSIFVTDNFISSISNTIPMIYYPLDIRRMISSQLQLIASECRSSQETITETFNILLSNQAFIPRMVSRDTMNAQINILFNEAKQDAMSKQEHNREYLQTFFQFSLVFSGLSNNFFYMNIDNQRQGFYSTKYLNDWTYPPNTDNHGFTESEVCYCTDSASCSYPSGIYPNLTGSDSYGYHGIVSPSIVSSTQIPGLSTGCMPYESILESTLECFYNQDCLSQLFFNVEHIQSLNPHINSIYSNDTRIHVLIQQLFIENISITRNFDLFYSECKPNKCLYSFSSNGDVTFVMLAILSLIGGLYVGLRIISMLMIRLYQFIKRKCSERLSNKNRTDNLDKSVDFKAFVNKIRTIIINLNLFEESHRDEHRRRNEILSTRIYILLMITSFVIILLHASIISYTLTYAIKSPSIDIYRKFVETYPDLTCACQQSISSYSVFTSFSPRFHQFCSSLWTGDFIIPHFSPLNTTYTITGFVQSIASEIPAYGMRVLCGFAKEMVNESITTYLETTYLSTYLTDEHEFISNINISINNLKMSLSTTTTQFLQLMHDVTQGNQILSGAFTNAEMIYNSSAINEEHKIRLQWINPMNESCNCGLSTDLCTISRDEYCNYTFTYVFTDTCNYPDQHIFISCYPIGGLYSSKLTCFHDEKCIRIVLNAIPSYPNLDLRSLPVSIFMLNSNITSRFAFNTTARTLINELAIEEWNDHIDYQAYYEKCNPVECFYTITRNIHIATVVTTVVGLFGGISVVLKIIIPLIIKLIRWLFRKRSVDVFLSDSWYHYHLIKIIREMNFFRNIETDEHVDIRRNQIISTRLYIILWTSSLVILTVYHSLYEVKSNFEMNSSTIDVIEQYQAENFDEFTCPCSKIVVPFQTFTSLDFNLHQICSSKLISGGWLDALFMLSTKNSIHEAVLASHFKLLQSFCQSANTILSESIVNFNLMEFISINLLTEKQLMEQTISSILDFQNKTINVFKRNLNSIIDITLGNQLMSIYGTNWYFIPDPNGSNAFYTKSKSYNNCSCGTSQSSTCKDSLIIKNNTIVNGMFIGCLPITSLRLSTLECFYNQTCLNGIQQILDLQNISIINSLDPFASSQYSIETTLNDIIDHLMLEEWTYRINYTSYFNTCNLKKCTYSIMKTKNPLAIFMSLLGLYGGLTISLKCLAPLLIQISKYFLNMYKFNRQTVPLSS